MEAPQVTQDSLTVVCDFHRFRLFVNLSLKYPTIIFNLGLGGAQFVIG